MVTRDRANENKEGAYDARKYITLEIGLIMSLDYEPCTKQ